MRKIILAASIALLPVVAAAQGSGGTAGGAAGGSAGNGSGGTVGAASGTSGADSGRGGTGGSGASVGGQSDAGSGGSANGAPAGGITANLAPRFKTYVTEHEVPSYTYSEGLRVGAVLPETGITYGEVPAEFGTRGYRYTIVNDQPVIVEPRTRRVIQVIE